MKVALNPNVNFKANLIDEAKKNNKPTASEISIVAVSDSNRSISQAEMDKNLAEFNQALKDGEKIETVITSKHWDKSYIPESDTVHAKMPGVYDGLEYTIYSNGKVVTETGWSNPKVERESDEKLAKYVEQMKNGEIAEAATFSKEDNSTKPAEFKEILKNQQWKKTYLPESDVVWVEQKGLKDGIAYCLEKDGTVKKTVLNTGKSEVIIEADKDMSKLFNDIKADESKPKKSFFYKVKDAIGDTWKFFSMAGTMTMATAKGLVYGTGTALGVLAGSLSLKLLSDPKNYKNILSRPLKSIGTAGKVIAAVAGTLVLATNIVKGKLKANEDTAIIEHKMRTDHRDD